MPYFTGAPKCRSCGKAAILQVTSTENNKYGNAGRPYYSCTTEGCEALYTFDDDRGVLDENPACECGRPSRRVIRSRKSDVVGFKFQCATGACPFNVSGGYDGNQETIHDDDLQEWIREGKV